MKKTPELNRATVIKGLETMVSEYNRKLKSYEEELAEAQEPKEWHLFFVFPKVSIALVGQAAKDLYEKLERDGSGLNVKFNISHLKHDYYEAKLLMVSYDYEII